MFDQNGSGGFAVSQPVPVESVIVQLNPSKPSLRMPFDVAGQYLIANAGYREVHAAQSAEEAQAIVRDLEEQSRRWAKTQPAAKIIPLF